MFCQQAVSFVFDQCPLFIGIVDLLEQREEWLEVERVVEE
jgi:hypothetical protein